MEGGGGAARAARSNEIVRGCATCLDLAALESSIAAFSLHPVLWYGVKDPAATYVGRRDESAGPLARTRLYRQVPMTARSDRGVGAPSGNRVGGACAGEESAIVAAIPLPALGTESLPSVSETKCGRVAFESENYRRTRYGRLSPGKPGVARRVPSVPDAERRWRPSLPWPEGQQPRREPTPWQLKVVASPTRRPGVGSREARSEGHPEVGSC